MYGMPFSVTCSVHARQGSNVYFQYGKTFAVYLARENVNKATTTLAYLQLEKNL